MARLLCILVLGLTLPSMVAAEETVAAIGELHVACREAQRPGPRKLYAINVPRFRFEAHDEIDDVLPIDTRRNLRVLRGSAEIFPTGLESIGFRASARRAEELRERGRKLRLGFFLRFDGIGRPCVIRSAVAVTTVRADIAFVELLDARGRVVAREDTERLRAWQDDAERDGIAGEGPRALVHHVTANDSSASPAMAQVFGTAALRRQLGQCYADSGSEGDAQMTVRARIEVGGRASDVEVELSTIRSAEAQACVVQAIQRLQFASAGVLLRIPIRFAD